MHGQPGIHRNRAPEFFDQTHSKVDPDHWLGHIGDELQERSAGYINHHTSEGFIKRGIRRAVAINTGAIAKGLLKRLTDCDADILNCVVRIHGSVTSCFQLDVPTRMFEERMHHVIQEEHSGIDLDFTRHERERQLNGCLASRAPDGSSSPGHTPTSCVMTSSIAERNAVFSSGSPMLTRRCPTRPRSGLG